ncbi:elongation factor G [Tissierella praeacuta DSM 18095]|uniref:Elongation factor G n=1 Tax=Tissierella praeacuta DSM 18095 TaxID=1123404 RepID=A0A1M4XZD9_9FIRM|nr:elongation factor G [Tissierella praeacuta]TCU69746.1 elongation factor G [Tissierella praeacuta]SHE98861.1 elongation factor G [Tissierella praeacuta DSM 18095]SUP03374.1 Vegetative protein 19 [Tissierella praeacuta]
MKTYSADKIRNVALLGHSSSGKTTLTEAVLFATGVTKRQGRVEDGNTVSDFDKEEIARKVSIGTTVIPVEWKDTKFNLLDTPGYFDFIGEMYGAKRASEGSVLLVDASSGIEVGTEKAWKNLEKYVTPRIIFLNKMDKEEVDFDNLLSNLKETFGDKIVPFTLPIGVSNGFKGFVSVIDAKAYEYNGIQRKEVEITEEQKIEVESIKEGLMEKVAETDEALMEKYFEGEEFTQDEIAKGLKTAVINGDLVPLIVGSAEKAIGCDFLLEIIERYIPSPKEIGIVKGMKEDNEIERKIDVNEPFSGIVFKTIIDPFVGKLTLFKVVSGKITKDMELYNSTKDKVEKLGGLFVLRGKNQIEVSEIQAGDIGATAKLNFTRTGDTLCSKNNPILYEEIKYPQPTLFLAVEPKAKGDEEKIGVSLQKLTDEDPTFIVQRNAETKQLLIGGQGNMQLTVIVDKLKNAFGVEVNLTNPKIAYRETIKGTASVQGKHKKQSGGAGQYGDVHIRFEPCEEKFVFAEEVFGGAVPRNYFPAVEKGLVDSLEHGVLAGYPVVNMKATLFDGSYHPVDSNEMAFKIAASLAFKKGMEAAKPILLEPIMKYEISIPEDYMGDVMGDMNKRRGRILGMEQQDDGTQKVSAEAPHSEMFEYAIDLRAMTQARGSFTMEFARYEEVPSNIAEKIIAEAKAEKE